MRILVAEDDLRIVAPLVTALEAAGHRVDAVHDGTTALERSVIGAYDALVLDVMMPGKNGFEISTELRALGDTTPIVLVTARGELDDRVEGLDAGADAYLVKPFDVPELLAVLRAVVRRRGEQGSSRVRLLGGDATYDFHDRTLQMHGSPILLTTRELDVLEALLHAQGKWCTRDDVLDKVWGPFYEGRERVADVYVRYLRRQMGDSFIESERGKGYRIL